MTQDKAREYFSAYHEGTLEPGLRSSLERRFASDAALKAELNAYVETVATLDAMRHEAIASPAYLSDRIAARLEGARDLAPARPFWADWLAIRPARTQLAWGMGVAAVLLVSAFGLRGMHADVPNSLANIVPSVAPNDPVTWTTEDGGLVARFEGGAPRQITVAPEGGAARVYSLAKGQKFEVALSNPNVAAQRFKISVGKDLFATVALPGSRRAARKPGAGTVTEFASALADAYGEPVVVKDMAVGSTIRWTFGSADAYAAAEAALHEQGHAIVTDGNVLRIGQ